MLESPTINDSPAKALSSNGRYSQATHLKHID